jgi:hypothetical protein
MMVSNNHPSGGLTFRRFVTIRIKGLLIVAFLILATSLSS